MEGWWHWMIYWMLRWVGGICICYGDVTIWTRLMRVTNLNPDDGHHHIRTVTSRYNVTIQKKDSWWRHQIEIFQRYWLFVRGIHQSLVDSPHKDQWRGALVFTLICAWTHGWINNRDAGDLRRHRGHYDVTVMFSTKRSTQLDQTKKC